MSTMKRVLVLIPLLTMLMLAGCDYHPSRWFPPNQDHIIKCAFRYPGEDCSDLK